MAAGVSDRMWSLEDLVEQPLKMEWNLLEQRAFLGLQRVIPCIKAGPKVMNWTTAAISSQ
jgi:hypothetical protein